MARADFKILVEGKTANFEGIFFRIEVFSCFRQISDEVSESKCHTLFSEIISDELLLSTHGVGFQRF